MTPAADGAPPARGRAALPFVLAAGGVAAITILRRPDAVTLPQFWAEDGTLFFRDQILFGLARTVAEPSPNYGSYFLLQRLVAAFAAPLGAARAPAIYNGVALAVAAGALGAFALPAGARAVADVRLRVLWALVVAAIVPAEILSRLSNVAWYVTVWCLVATVMRMPRTRGGWVGFAAAYAVAVCSAPLGVLAAPVWAARASWAAVRRRDPGDALGAGAMAAITVLSVAALSASRPLALDGIRIALTQGIPVATSAAMLGPVVTHRLLDAGGHAAVWVVTGVVLGVFLAATRRPDQGRARAVLVLSLYAIGATVGTVYGGRSFYATIHPAAFLGGLRYATVPYAMAALAAIAFADSRHASGARLAVATGCALLLLGAPGRTFRERPFDDWDWPTQARRLTALLDGGSRELLRIPINPYPFAIVINGRVQAVPLADTPTPRVLAFVAPGVSVRQTFAVPCDILAGFDMMARTGAGTAQRTMRFRVEDAANARLLADSGPLDVTIEDDRWLTIDLPLTPNMAARTLALQIEVPASGGPVGLMGGLEEGGPEGFALSAGGVGRPGRMSLRARCQS